MSHRPAIWDPLRAPVNVTWEITAKWNLQCRHCLSADMRETLAAELGFEQCCAFIDELDRMEVFQMNTPRAERVVSGSPQDGGKENANFECRMMNFEL